MLQDDDCAWHRDAPLECPGIDAGWPRDR